MEKAGRRFPRTSNNNRGMDKIRNTNQSCQMEACQILMDTLNIDEPDNEMCRLKDTLRVGDIKKKLEHEDLSYWDELEILNEEDFSGQEEQRELSMAEKLLMDQIVARNCSKDGRKVTPKQPYGGAEPTTVTSGQPCGGTESTQGCDTISQEEDNPKPAKAANNSRTNEVIPGQPC